VAITVQYQTRSRLGRDSGLTQLVGDEPLTTHTGEADIDEGGAQVVALAGGATDVAVALGGVVNVRYLMIKPITTSVIFREVVGDTGIAIKAGKALVVEFDETGGWPPVAVLLSNVDGAVATDVLVHLAGTD